MSKKRNPVQAQISKKFRSYVTDHPENYPEPERFLESLTDWPVKAARANTHVESIENLCKLWDIAYDPVPWCSDATYFDYTSSLGQTGEHNMGLCYIGDASAMLPISSFDIPSDATVIDMCAAPGGKSVHALNSLGAQGTLIANDIDTKRMKTLKENLERMSTLIEKDMPTIELRNMACDELAETFSGQANVVILDAPCSGEAMMRRSDMARRQWSEKLVMKMSLLQKVLMGYARELLAPGGVIIYSTCTFNELENEGVVDFASENLGLTAQKLEVKNGLVETRTGVAAYPHLARGDGQSIAVLQS